MKKNRLIVLTAMIAGIVAVFFVLHLVKHRHVKIDPGFSEYISAFTAGTIPVKSTIKIELVKEVPSVEINSEVDLKLFSFYPSVIGKAYWIDNHTIEFRPDKPFDQGTQFTVKFSLHKLIKNIPKKFESFEFEFQTIKQAISFQVDGYQPYILTDLKWNTISGMIRTADIADNVDIEKIVSAKQNSKALNLRWSHNDIAKTHSFTIDSVIREVNTNEVIIEWNGKIIGSGTNGTQTIKIPSINDFNAIEANVIQGEQQYIAIRFTDPIDPNQDLNGLIHFADKSDFTFEVDKMTIKVYPSTQVKGTQSLVIEPGIRNIAEGKLKTAQTFELFFETLKPAIKLLGKGVILPNSKGLTFPFQAVNIKAVDLSIIKIYENNITQFLQVNQLDGTSELSRAGKLLLKKTIQLDAEKSFAINKWNTYSIDLSKLIKQEPGAIYRIQLSFKKQYSTYPCDGEEASLPKDNMVSVQQSVDYTSDPYSETNVNYYDQDYDSYNYDYNWNERDDPCKSSYYNGANCNVSRNILASDIGLIAKIGSDDVLNIAVANLISTKSMSGVSIEVYDYQKQIIAVGKSDNNGFCTIPIKGQPFLIIAKDGDQRGYLRIDDQSALSLSNFDVSGETVNKGLKGFIFGERGVWRPGDTVFLTFILEDKLNKLPANHPVVLEVINPKGQLYKKFVKSSGVNGIYAFSFNTDENDPTGNWMVNIKIGGITFSKFLKIESIKPNRLKISFDPGVSYIKTKINANLNAKWLHGAIAKNLKANVMVTFNAAHTSFKGFDKFTFDDPIKKFESTDKNIFDGQLDERGDAHIFSDLNVGNTAPGMLNANFVTRVFEPGGDFSIDRFSLTYSPYKVYIGIKPPEDEYGYLYTDTAQIFDIVSLSQDGKLISQNNLEVLIYKLEWRWWWDSESDNMANFANNTSAKPVYSEKISTFNGKAKIKYKLEYPEWGRYLIRVTDTENGHSTGKVVYYDWPGWRGRANRGDAKGAVMLSFNSDKKMYHVGEKATITVPSSAGGHILVSIESGSQVLKSWWVETAAKETKTTFEVTEKMTPNIFLHVTLLQPHSQTINDLPIRMYGIIPITVEDPATHIYPVITMPDVVQPEKQFTVQVNEKMNHPMSYTLAIVDDGLLDLTRFKTPDPWTSFYGREALGVKTWDLYDMVMGAFDGRIESLFAIGGDNALNGGKTQKANRFKPIVKYLGPFSLKSGVNKHNIVLPQYVGSIRVMVVAAGNYAFGKEEKTVAVRKPLMVLGTLPRVLGPGEEVTLPVSVFVMEKGIHSFKAEVITNELFQVTDNRSQIINVKEPGEFDLSFHLKVTSREGVGKVKVLVTSGSEKSEFDIELNVRNPNLKITQVEEALVEAGKSITIPYSLIGTIGSNKATLEVSSIPPIDLNKRLEYLLTYPYGCVEQTTSSVFAQLYIDKFITLSVEDKKKRDINISSAIQRLNTMLVADGGFAYWPGGYTADEWGSNYAGHFLIEAELKGFAIPSGFKKNWLAYQHKMARGWIPNRAKYDPNGDQLVQAYRLYSLALAKESDIGAMNRMKEMSDLSVTAIWRLAAAYLLVGQQEIAKQLINKAGDNIKTDNRFNITFGSEERDWAMMLETLTLLGDKTKAFAYVKKLSSVLSQNQWLSTQTTAYSLLSISKFLEMQKISPVINFTFSGGGKTNMKINSHSPLSQIKLDAFSSGPGKISLDNTGVGLLFMRIITEGRPEVGQLTGYDNNLKMNLVFKSGNGAVLDVSKLTQGTDFTAVITIKNNFNGYVTNLALNQVFPSGWEIGNDRLDKENKADQEESHFTYQDIRDDRVNTFFDIGNSHSRTFVVRLTAAYLGKFYFPGTLCEAMYDAGVNSFIPGKWVEIVK